MMLYECSEKLCILGNSGIAALIKSYKPDLTSVQIAGILRSDTRTISTLKEKVKSDGIIDAYACLNEARKLTK